MEVAVVKSEDFGLEEKKGQELTLGLDVVIAERALLIEEFKTVSKLEINPLNIPKFKELRIRIMKNRTQGVNKWHKSAKAFSLAVGNFVDAKKNMENEVNEGMEQKLLDAEKHYEIQEQLRIDNLQTERAYEIEAYIEDAHERDLGSMEEDVWLSFLATKKKEHEEWVKAEAKAEKARIAKEKAEEAERVRLKKENDRLKAEADERNRAELARIAEEKEAEIKRRQEEETIRTRENAQRKANEARIAAKEKAKRDKIEAEKEAERVAKEKAEAKLKAIEDKKEADRIAKEEAAEAELKKGDAQKVEDLKLDLAALKYKYSFESAANKKMYTSVGGLIDKVIDWIK